MEAASLYHNPWPPYVQGNQPDDLRVVLRAKRGDLREAYVIYGDRYSDVMSGRATMDIVGSDDRHDYLVASLKLSTGRYKYYFYLEGVDGSVGWFSDAGLSQEPWNARVFQMPHTAALPKWDGPEWAQDAVCYQVFIDRFRNGNAGNDPAGVSPWWSQPDLHTRLGGDLQGVIDSLPYLQDLGVTMLYLTPVFAAPSGHKYDTADYYKVDPEFGDMETLRSLTTKAHERGMKVVLDGVFNHCGIGFFAFQDVLEKGQASKYSDWFNIYSFPVTMHPPSYETFGNAIAEMPKLRLSNPAVSRYFINVATYWVREAGVDGWRLDVANEIDLEFVRTLRREIRAVHPESYIVGEIWHSAEPWLRGDTLDGVTAYPWRDAALAFFSGWRFDSAWLDAQLLKHFYSARPEALRSSLNLLGSHDTPRVLELMGGDRNKTRLLVAFQMTSPGIPQIYYGDEVEMRGWSDPECRRGMTWSETFSQNDMLLLYKRLTTLRRKHAALRRGDFRSLHRAPGDPFYAFLRQHSEGNVVAVFNTAWHERSIELPGHWLRAGENIELVELTGWGCLPDGGAAEKQNAVSSRRKPVALRVGPQSACLLAPANPAN